MPEIITLTTDFGLDDEYVGVMKGVILSRAPEAVIVDLCHGIARHDIRQAALLISSAYRFFPDRTIHLVVVDPGVGGSRKIILLQADGHLFLAPDNGVLGLLFGDRQFQAAYEVQCEQYYRAPVSNTFHGRDIMAPVAAALAGGLAPAAAGPAIAPRMLKRLDMRTAAIDRGKGTIRGEITAVDHFGNLLTNITATSLDDLYGAEKQTIRIRLRHTCIIGIQTAYSHKAENEVLAIVSSRGVLEIGVNRGNAAIMTGSAVGDRVIVARQ